MSHLHGYNVHESLDWIVIHPGQQIDYHPLDAHRSEWLNGDMIWLRHKPHKVITENKGKNKISGMDKFEKSWNITGKTRD